MARGMYVLCEIEGVLARASHRKAVSDADAGALIAGDELIFPTSRMLRGFARSGAEVVLITGSTLFRAVSVLKPISSARWQSTKATYLSPHWFMIRVCVLRWQILTSDQPFMR